jgi:uncharacterized protein (TIGR02271 family)
MAKTLQNENESADAGQANLRDRSVEVTSGTLRLLAEELSVDRREIETGRVRVATVTREREELVDVPLTREHVEVTHVPVGRTVERMPSIRQDGDTTIVPVVEEILVTERRLILKEEVHIRRVRTTERHQERVKLRHQEAVVTRTPIERSEEDGGSSSGAET